VPTRLLIGPGFALIGAGLLLMRGLDAASDWTHLPPGLIVAGIGAGLVNVPLASTAVSVVEPTRAGPPWLRRRLLLCQAKWWVGMLQWI
jgi:hypothetical protein